MKLVSLIYNIMTDRQWMVFMREPALSSICLICISLFVSSPVYSYVTCPLGRTFGDVWQAWHAGITGLLFSETLVHSDCVGQWQPSFVTLLGRQHGTHAAASAHALFGHKTRMHA